MTNISPSTLPASATRIADQYDYLHYALRAAVEVKTTRCLWTWADRITFKPMLCDTVWGDGRALFKLTTINNRPAFWIIRGDSGWSCDDGDGPEFVEFTDDILTALEGQFGSARCGYSGSSLYLEPEYRDCDCDECSGPYMEVAKWPMVDDDCGCSWSRMKWPRLRARYTTVPHPFSWKGDLIERVRQP